MLPVCSGCTWPRSTALGTRGCTRGGRGRCSPSPHHTRTAHGTRESDTCRDRSAGYVPATTHPTMETAAGHHHPGVDWRKGSFRGNSPQSCPAPVRNAYNPNQLGAYLGVPGVSLGWPTCHLSVQETFTWPPVSHFIIIYVFSCTFGKIYAVHEPYILLKTKLDLRHLKSM